MDFGPFASFMLAQSNHCHTSANNSLKIFISLECEGRFFRAGSMRQFKSYSFTHSMSNMFLILIQVPDRLAKLDTVGL